METNTLQYILHLLVLSVISCIPSLWNTTGITVAGTTGVLGNNSTLLAYTNDVAVDVYFNIYVADADNQRIQRFPSNSLVGQTIAGTSSVGSSSTQFNYPRAIFVSTTTLFVSDVYNYRIQKFNYNSSSGITVAGGNKR